MSAILYFPSSEGVAITLFVIAHIGPDCLTTELNPHATELNPHQAVPGGQPHKGRSNDAFRVGAVGHGYYKSSGA